MLKTMTVEHGSVDPFANMRTWRSQLSRKGWWHSFELPDGTRIDGLNDIEWLKQRIGQFPIPEDLRGARVLDIGAWDGWFSFEMERRGAEVVAIDNWDNPRFREIHRLLHSRVDYRQMDVYDLTPNRIGRFDIVLFMGVLYHLKHPLLALERVCALTTGMAAVDSFILREEHIPGVEVETRPIMAFYETDEFAGQTDNWVAPSLPCLLAFCRSAGFARVEFRGIVVHGACVACYRQWEPLTASTSEAPKLADVFHNANGAINFESDRDTYLSAFVDSSMDALTRQDVMPEVGGYGEQPLAVWKFAEYRWQVVFKLPPGLTPGWHDVRVRIKNSLPSNALRIAVDLPFEPGPIRIAGVRDGTTWVANEVDLQKGAALAVWIQGLPENADRDNVRVFLSGLRLEMIYMGPAANEIRQVNVLVPREAESGVAHLEATAGGHRSEPAKIVIR